jgi:outer membrane protein OmpA-like peptidoglycan-associated protein
MGNIRFCFFLLVFVFGVKTVCFTENTKSPFSPFFFEGAAHFAPEILSDSAQPKPGFRGALGYEWRRLRFSLASGYTSVAAANPLVQDLVSIPLTFRAGYEHPLLQNVTVRADIGIGFLFSAVNNYETALNMYMDVPNNQAERSLLGEGRILAAYTFPGDFIQFYAGGGTSLLFETQGPVFQPAFEAGIIFKPFAIGKKTPALPERKRVTVETVPDVIIPETVVSEVIVFTHTRENVVIEESAEGRTVRLLNAVYFEPDSAVMIETYRPVLNAAGEGLQANPRLKISLRAYAAPRGTEAGQLAVSEIRAQFCKNYFMRYYGVTEERMDIEFYGASQAPELVDATLESWRCVELIIITED